MTAVASSEASTSPAWDHERALTVLRSLLPSVPTSPIPTCCYHGFRAFLRMRGKTRGAIDAAVERVRGTP